MSAAFDTLTLGSALDASGEVLPLKLIASFVDGIAAFDPERRCMFWSEGMQNVTGLAPDEALGRAAPEVLPFLRAPGEEARLEQSLFGKRSLSRSVRFAVVTTGREGYLDVHYAPLEARSGSRSGCAVVVHDVTQGWIAREKLLETEQRFKNMADVAPVLLWMSREDSLCTFFNQTWLSFTGRTLEEEWGVGWTEGVHPEDFASCMDGYIAAFNERRVLELEYRLRRHDGVYRWILDRGTPRYTPDGTFAGFIGSCIDITERKNMEVELRQAIRARDEFLSIAAHELRTPLTPLSMHLQSLLRSAKAESKPLTPEQLLSRLHGAERQMARFAHLVDTLLDVTRITGGRLSTLREEVDLSALVREVLSRFELELAAAKCTLHAALLPTLVGRWDRLRLDQVVNNLVSNAIKFGSGKPVEVSLEQQGSRAVLSVRDHGIGIAPEHQARIFERFERAVSMHNYGGFGLGLWIARQVVEALGGEIRVTSQPGEGACFVVALPLSEGEQPTANVGPTSLEVPLPQPA